MYDINKRIEPNDLMEQPLEEVVPKQYHDFLPLLHNGLADRLPPHRAGIDNEVQLREGKMTTCGPLYSMSGAE